MADVHECSESNQSFLKAKNAAREKRKRLPSSDYIVKRRQPFSLKIKREEDIYVTNKTNFKALLKKCEELLSNSSEVIIHGLGSSVFKACNLGLQLKEIHYGALELDIKTSTVSIVDDFEPLNDSCDYETISRNNSAIHIRVFRKFTINDLKYQE